MSVSGLVILLSDDEAQAREAVRTLRQDRRLLVGDRFGRRLALVAETHSCDEDLSLVESLQCMQGVDHVEVVFVEVDAPRRGTEGAEP